MFATENPVLGFERPEEEGGRAGRRWGWSWQASGHRPSLRVASGFQTADQAYLGRGRVQG